MPLVTDKIASRHVFLYDLHSCKALRWRDVHIFREHEANPSIGQLADHCSRIGEEPAPMTTSGESRKR